jgi:septum formation protein
MFFFLSFYPQFDTIKSMLKILILASQSPRRSEILKTARYFFIPFPVYVSEIPQKNLSLDHQIIDIARRKAEACVQQFPDLSQEHIVLASDTMVCLDHIALGKPEDEQQAFEFLSALSNRSHQVKTAVVLYDHGSKTWISHIETTDVAFKKISVVEIWDYIKTQEPMDKAGAYAIQGLGGKFVEKMSGEFNNVVGLPLHALEKLFTMSQWQIQRIP